VINMANTFGLRAGPDAPEKSGKDLLYLRDIMAGGRQVEMVLNEDIDAMLESSDRSRFDDALRSRAHAIANGSAATP
jgi:hypothetical protein